MMNRSDWLYKAGFGLFVHWTTHSYPQSGEKKAYLEAVKDFNIDAFVDQVAETGAKFVIFTINHAEIRVPFPCTMLDTLFPEEACGRDLISELADALEAKEIRLMLYFNGDGSRSPKWRELTGFVNDPSKHAEYVYKLVEEISIRYGKRIHGWWIDCCLEPPVGDTGLRYDYEKFANALRAGNPDSIVAFNYTGIMKWASQTGVGIVDYQAGEDCNLDRVPSSRFSGECGVQWFSVIPMEDQGIRPILHNNWVHAVQCEPVPLYSNEAALAYRKDVQNNGGVFAYNVGPYQEGIISAKTMKQLIWLKEHMAE